MRGDLFPMVDFGYNYRVPILQYALGIVNGAGPNMLDDNNVRDVIAVTVKPSAIVTASARLI